MYKTGIIGDRESVVGFRAVGIDAIPARTGEEAAKAEAEKDVMADDADVAAEPEAGETA